MFRRTTHFLVILSAIAIAGGCAPAYIDHSDPSNMSGSKRTHGSGGGSASGAAQQQAPANQENDPSRY